MNPNRTIIKKIEIDVGFSTGLAMGIYLGSIGLGLGLLLFASGAEWTWEYWGGNNLDRSSVIRNIALAALGTIGLTLAAWRSWVAHRQVETANEQSKIANIQATTSRFGLQVERFQKAVELLGPDKQLFERLAGIRTLEALAREDTALMYEPVIWTLVDFINHSQNDNTIDDFFDPFAERDAPDYLDYVHDTPEAPPKFVLEIDLAINTLFQLRDLDGASDIETEKGMKIVLRGLLLSSISIKNGNMSGIEIESIVAAYLSIVNCNLRNTKITYAYGIGCHIVDCDISNSELGLGRDWRIKDCYYSDLNPPSDVRMIDESRGYFSWRTNGIGAVPVSVKNSPLPSTQKTLGSNSSS